ncbi:hypothetical protein [Bradyrhizobium sp. USDA 3315]
MPEATLNNSIISSRRGFLSGAAVAATGGAVMALAAIPPAVTAATPMAAVACPDADPVFALIARHRAEERAYSDALMALSELCETLPEEARRSTPRVQLGMKGGEPYYLHTHAQIDDRLGLMPDFASTPEIRARLHAELDRDRTELWTKQDENGVTDADGLVLQLCESCQELEWALANTMPTSLAGVAAVLRYANECEDQGNEWPDTDTIGREGWHYQLRQTMAAAVVNLA